MRNRFDPLVAYLRVSLQRKDGQVLLATIRQELDSIAIPALAADTSGRYIFANAKAGRLTGYTSAELVGMSVMELTPLPAMSDGGTLWAEFMSTGVQHGAYDVRRKDGTSVRVRYWAYANVAPGVHISLLKAQETVAA